MIRVSFSEEAEAIYRSLLRSSLKTDRTLLFAIDRKTEILKMNQMHGVKVKKRLIPKVYEEKCQVTNLFRVGLPMFWRMLYTVKVTEEEIVVFVLDILNHKDYDTLFGYRKK